MSRHDCIYLIAVLVGVVMGMWFQSERTRVLKAVTPEPLETVSHNSATCGNCGAATEVIIRERRGR